MYSTILENYPKRAVAGGFDLLLYQRGGGGFYAINGPHTASKLKYLCGQAKVYLRPVQRDIPLEHYETSDNLSLEDSSCEVQVLCVTKNMIDC